MKKLIALLSVVVFVSPVFALNATNFDEKKCAEEKSYFRSFINRNKGNEAAITQYILMTYAEPMAKLADAEALPLAECYATFNINGQALIDFTRQNAGIFTADQTGKIEDTLRAFASRVEDLSVNGDWLGVMDSSMTDYELAEHILTNVADPFAKLSDEEAAPLAESYMSRKVKGQPFIGFVEKQGGRYAEFGDLETFAARVRRLAK